MRDVDANLEKQYWACSHPLELYQLGDYYNLRLRVNNAIASPIIPLVNNHKLPFSPVTGKICLAVSVLYSVKIKNSGSPVSIYN